LGGVDWTRTFGRYDKTGDGLLALDEFNAVVRRELKISPKDLNNEEVRLFFQYLDADGSGEVDIAELKQFLHEMGEEDKNKNVMTPALLKLVRRKLLESEEAKGGVDWVKMFKMYDTSGDGALGLAEIRSIVRKELMVMSHVLNILELKSLFSYLDKDKTGSINVHEFVQFIYANDEDELNSDDEFWENFPPKLEQAFETANDWHAFNLEADEVGPREIGIRLAQTWFKTTIPLSTPMSQQMTKKAHFLKQAGIQLGELKLTAATLHWMEGQVTQTMKAAKNNHESKHALRELVKRLMKDKHPDEDSGISSSEESVAAEEEKQQVDEAWSPGQEETPLEVSFPDRRSLAESYDSEAGCIVEVETKYQIVVQEPEQFVRTTERRKELLFASMGNQDDGNQTSRLRQSKGSSRRSLLANSFKSGSPIWEEEGGGSFVGSGDDDSAASPSAALRGGDAVEIFKMVDADGSGTIDSDEARKMGISKAQIKQMDFDGDGKISVAELAMAAPSPQASTPATTSRSFTPASTSGLMTPEVTMADVKAKARKEMLASSQRGSLEAHASRKVGQSCTNCSTVMMEGSLFCRVCGHRRSEATTPMDDSPSTRRVSEGSQGSSNASKHMQAMHEVISGRQEPSPTSTANSKLPGAKPNLSATVLKGMTPVDRILLMVTSVLKAERIHLADFLRRMDVDESGTLSAKELRVGLAGIGLILKNHDFQELLDYLDPGEAECNVSLKVFCKKLQIVHKKEKDIVAALKDRGCQITSADLMETCDNLDPHKRRVLSLEELFEMNQG
jgi:Ca2+-binding EF-hand superfamily protein